MPPGQRVLVLGAGFAGVHVAKSLQDVCEVTVLAPTDRFVFLPLIHEVLGEKTSPGQVTKPLDEILPGCELVYGRAARVEGKEVVTAAGDHLAFDQLVVAVGAEPNDFGVPGVREHALPFYSVGDALRANATLKHTVAELDEDRPLRVRIVGASFTGVEVAGEVADVLDGLDVARDIVLLDALPEIFPHQSEAFREAVHEGLKRQGLELRTERMITEVTEDSLTVRQREEEHTEPSDVTFWCAGVRPRTVPGVTHEVRGTLQSWDRDDIFILGDAARFPPEMGVPRLAQTAEDQAPIVAHNLLHPDQMRTYEPKVKGLMLSMGDKLAVAELTDGPHFKGRIPWHVKRNLYKAKIRGL